MTTTPNFNLNLIDFDKITWHKQDHDNWRIIDTVLSKFVTIINLKGVWDTSLAIAVGDRYVDRELGTIWTANIAHTSLASGTFAADRIVNPTQWTLFSTIDATFAGTWTTGTVYSNNSFVVDSNRYGVAINVFTSSSSYDLDVTNGNIVTLIDLTTDLAAAATSATNAAASEAAAAASAASITSPLPVASGGTESTTASGARTNLGLAIGTDVLPELAVVSQADAEAGTATDEKIWTAQRVNQAIAALTAASTLDASGTTMLFYQATLPTGWTRDVTSIHDMAIRVDTTTTIDGSFIGNKGGANLFNATLNASHASVIATDAGGAPSHTHTINLVNTSGGATAMAVGVSDGLTVADTVVTSAPSGGTAAHKHNIDLDLSYINVFIASKD